MRRTRATDRRPSHGDLLAGVSRLSPERINWPLTEKLHASPPPFPSLVVRSWPPTPAHLKRARDALGACALMHASQLNSVSRDTHKAKGNKGQRAHFTPAPITSNYTSSNLAVFTKRAQPASALSSVAAFGSLFTHPAALDRQYRAGPDDVQTRENALIHGSRLVQCSRGMGVSGVGGGPVERCWVGAVQWASALSGDR